MISCRQRDRHGQGCGNMVLMFLLAACFASGICVGVGLVKFYESFQKQTLHAQESPGGTVTYPSDVCVSRAGKRFHVSEDCPALVGKRGLQMLRRCDHCSKDHLYRTSRGKAMTLPSSG